MSLNISLSHSRSLKVIENGTMSKLGYGFLFDSVATMAMAVYLAVFTLYTNVMDRQPPHDDIGRSYA